MKVIGLILSALREAEKLASRGEAAYWLLRGRPVAYGMHLETPVKIWGNSRVLFSNCRFEKPADWKSAPVQYLQES